MKLARETKLDGCNESSPPHDFVRGAANRSLCCTVRGVTKPTWRSTQICTVPSRQVVAVGNTRCACRTRVVHKSLAHLNAAPLPSTKRGTCMRAARQTEKQATGCRRHNADHCTGGRWSSSLVLRRSFHQYVQGLRVGMERFETSMLNTDEMQVAPFLSTG